MSEQESSSNRSSDSRPLGSTSNQRGSTAPTGQPTSISEPQARRASTIPSFSTDPPIPRPSTIPTSTDDSTARRASIVRTPIIGPSNRRPSTILTFSDDPPPRRASTVPTSFIGPSNLRPSTIATSTDDPSLRRASTVSTSIIGPSNRRSTTISTITSDISTRRASTISTFNIGPTDRTLSSTSNVARRPIEFQLPASRPSLLSMRIAPEDPLLQEAQRASISEPRVSFASSNDFEEDFLATHNKFRELHGCPPLQLKPELSRIAQEWAAKYAAGDPIHLPYNYRFGRNVYSDTRLAITGEEPVESWYGQRLDYDYDRAEPLNPEKTKYFTQLLWKATAELGFGLARTTHETYIVGIYYPRGNVSDEYRRNVPRLIVPELEGPQD